MFYENGNSLEYIFFSWRGGIARVIDNFNYMAFQFETFARM